MDKNIAKTAKNTVDIISKTYDTIEKIIPALKFRRIKYEELEFYMRQLRERDDLSDVIKASIALNYNQIVKEVSRCYTVTELAEKYIEKDAKPENINNDWYEFFFDKVKLVSDEYMQEIWARILAGKINDSKNYSMSLIHTLSIMEKNQANDFCNVSRFCMKSFYEEDVVNPLIFISKNIKPYQSSKITRTKLLELQRLGLIQCDFNNEFVFINKVYFKYGNNRIKVVGDKNNKDKILAGNVIFTRDGSDLYKIVGDEFKEYRTDILDFTVEKFLNRNCEVYKNDQKLK